jgi:hypothetical protein
VLKRVGELLCHAVILHAAEGSEESRSGLFGRQRALRHRVKLEPTFPPFSVNNTGRKTPLTVGTTIRRFRR